MLHLLNLKVYVITSVILTVRICTYVRTYKCTYDLPYVNVCFQLYVQIRAIYVQYTAQIVLYTYTTYLIRSRTYTLVFERICMYMTLKEPYVGLTGAVCECISNEYVQILTPFWGHRLYVYERICMYLIRNTCIYVLHVYARIYA